MNVDLCVRGTEIQERHLSTISVNMGRMGVQQINENRINGASEVSHGQGELRGGEIGVKLEKDVAFIPVG